ncbi:MAG: radical SAM family heme chaperone HemW [Hyphomicrobiaceae bacterium]
MNDTKPGFGIYVHWPFCAQKCPYCDFNSHVRVKAPDHARFLAAYRRELGYAQSVTGRRQPVTSIFFGGGTPSLMPPEVVAGILDEIATLWDVEGGAEITLEANPGSVEADRFAGYRAAGVNRVSLGVQSLHDAELRRLGRVHSVAEAKAALAIAARTFPRFTFDMIYARPGQTAHAWSQELSEALAMAGDHLSLYQLTIEPDTPYAALNAAGKLVIPEADTARALYDLTQEMTEAAGLPAYEISNHARPGAESRHNLTYWRYGGYVGVGAGAHGRLVRERDEARIATTTERAPEAWLEAVEARGRGFVDESVLGAEEQADEMLLMGLRISEGIDLERLSALTGLAPSRTAVARLAAEGLINTEAASTRLKASADGRLVLDWVVARLAESLVSTRPQHLPAA